MDAGDQWFERVLGKLHDSYALFAHNNQEPELTDKTQYGGVGLIASSELKHRIIDNGKDPTGLGRWVWIRIQGKEGHTTRIVSAYRPCQSDGAGSVFRQHQRVLSASGDHRTPLVAFREDLRAEILAWKTDGDHLVIGMDANEDVRSGEINTLFQRLGLHDAILDLHAGTSPPPLTIATLIAPRLMVSGQRKEFRLRLVDMAPLAMDVLLTTVTCGLTLLTPAYMVMLLIH